MSATGPAPPATTTEPTNAASSGHASPPPALAERVIMAEQREPREATVSAAERERVFELAKYFSATSIVPNAEQPPLDAPQAAPDTTLTSLAQLGLFKLDCQRAFVSLIDRSYQYLIAEATRSTSLVVSPTSVPTPTSNPDDNIYLGFRALELSFGVCPQTIELFTSDDRRIDSPNVTADRTRYIIRDFLADEHFRTKPYVTGWPHMRSYAEVPLTSANGYVIGSYCVVDNKPREFGDGDIALLTEVAGNIMNHLDLLKAKSDFHRAEGLVRGIGSYVAGYSGLQEQQTRPPVLTQRPALATAAVSPPRDERPRSRAKFPPSDSDTSPPSLSPVPEDKTASRPKLRRLESDVAQVSQSDSSIPTGSSRSKSKTGSTPLEMESANESFNRVDSETTTGGWREADQRADRELNVSQSVRDTFSRAGNLIRQSMGMQGVSFLDVSPEGFSMKKTTTTTTKTTNSSGRRGSLTSTSGSGSDDHMCNILGHSTEVENNLGTDTANSTTTDFFNISIALLRRMLKRYPFGHIFSFDEMGLILRSRLGGQYQTREHPSRRDFPITQAPEDFSEEEDATELFSAIKQARSIIFLPLWDFHKSRWSTAVLGWTTDLTRILDVGDLNYLSAFGNSIMAEISRLEASALSQAKSDFISSVTHELRSPLHGILAGTELLRKSPMTRGDSSMLDTIESCGNMLLNTIESLLDFAKIVSLTGKSKMNSDTSNEQSAKENAVRLAFVDLGVVVQDVVEGVYLGYTTRRSTEHEAHDNRAKAGKGHTNETTILVNIDPIANLTFETEVGAWERIVMNVFGNALKYTARGQIDVSLSVVDLAEDESEPTKYACLAINDTGRGIGEDYLRHRLYKPFSQENDLSDGTGLGLSIVQQLVNSLEGSIDIESKVGVGTSTTIMIPFGERLRGVDLGPGIGQLATTKALDPTGRLKGCTLHMPFLEENADGGHTSPRTSNRSASATALFHHTAEHWLGMVVILGEPSANLHVNSGKAAFLLSPKSVRPVGFDWSVRCLVSGREDDDKTWASTTEALQAKISLPLGPRKLASALLQALELQDKSARDARTPVARRPRVLSRRSLNPSAGEKPSGDEPFYYKHHSEPMPDVPPAFSTPDTRPLHLLLVDDNVVNLKVLATCVKQAGCTYVSAGNGREAVEAFKATIAKTPFDLVFMDLSMPVVDGYAATREIRQLERDAGLGERVRIYALTALGAEDARQQAFASGVDHFISKPVSMKEVRAIVTSNEGAAVGGAGR